MSLKQIDVHTATGGLLQLPLRGPSTYPVLGVEGLGPVAANIGTESLSGINGLQRTSSVIGGRDVVIKLGLNPTPGVNTVSDIRMDLYRSMPTGQDVRLVFRMDNGLVVYTNGEVERVEPNIFTKEPTVNVTVRCFQYDLKTLDTVSMTVVRTQAQIAYFETAFVNPGTEPCGVEIVLSTTAPLISGAKFTLRNQSGRQETIDLTVPISAITTSVLAGTEPSNRYVRVNRNGVITDEIHRKDRSSKWIMTYPGQNYFGVAYTLSTATAGNISAKMTYRPSYGGI